ncbi:MAG: hypothetical protein HRU23_19160 [Gammaproteobacteria bacterium]|nr:hypothetical protein [Gammaproteobacteria bacterium]
MVKRNWKREVPHSINHALQLCKEHGSVQKNLSVERIGDRMATSVDTLYKWLGSGKMPVNQLINYESLTTCNTRTGRPFVTEYLAHSQGYLLIKMPNGKNAEHKDILELNICMQQFVTQLLEFQHGTVAADKVLDSVKTLMQDLAFQHKNIEQHQQPQLDLEGAKHE